MNFHFVLNLKGCCFYDIIHGIFDLKVLINFKSSYIIRIPEILDTCNFFLY